ncbi:DIE2/ALG10 family-domain-containing protein [Diplogelasinospora grovesii]|uniref:Dol-P-Glc:Glc(2)Man(9)GlcNAc(2)-PP-Dol alpha-1,2-glucosyltransferase n=1 Tax=Diplogelasinospora grovesii TaxID=303347 RepID=A0AAN6MY80_9PEZI|nr:DIE2/ALG10 family-domain-containing protein [Diplogelasinospora grovesii]
MDQILQEVGGNLHRAVEVLRNGSDPHEVLKGLGIAALLSRFHAPHKRGVGEPSPLWKATLWAEAINIGGFFFIYLLSHAWLTLVNEYVPEPYLDEVFHIPQAQTYCEGRYWDWDDKITTPPGLYIVSLALHRMWKIAECTAASLRARGVLSILHTALLASFCRNLIEARSADSRPGEKKSQAFSLYSYHTAFNIALFPALFFFSGLYYTDVVSTQVVLIAYHNHLWRLSSEAAPSFANGLYTLLLGIAALLMRQTNVFWVVVYMGGLEAVHAVRSLSPAPVTQMPNLTTLSEHVRYYLGRYAAGNIHDPPLNLAWPDDWVLCGLSMAIAALCNPVRMLKQVWPQITLLGLFAAFVVWNGGVVLGDKSNHVATIHLAQMLYIWPFFAFFSAPLLLPSLLPCISLSVRMLGGLIYRTQKFVAPSAAAPSTAGSQDQPRERSVVLRVVNGFFVNKLGYYIPYITGTILLSVGIVKYNTIIHPFTLADNRHYMFYVFRYTILRGIETRYTLVAAYTLCRWLVWRTLAGCPPAGSMAGTTECPGKQNQLNGSAGKFINPPFPTTVMREAGNFHESNPNLKSSQKSSTDGEILGTLDEPSSTSTFSPSTSTALLWLLATTLSLVSAPLVEPRYFILPWVFWRLLVPAWPAHECTRGSIQLKSIWGVRWLFRLRHKVDLRLLLETVWFLAINLGTMYMFLFKPFYWRGPSGELLDGGRSQRFMW